MTTDTPATPVYTHGRPSVRGTRAMVASAHPLASLAGIAMMQRGGNAFDAIAATAAALNVVEPFMSGIGGLGMAVVRTADGRVRSLDFHPPVPRDFDAASLTKAQTQDGPNASGVPGSLAGWCHLVEELGRLDLATIFGPAMEYATEGVATSPFYSAMARRFAAREMSPEWHKVFVEGTAGAAADAVLRQPDLAATFTAIAAEGPAYLHDGPLGRAMVAHLRSLGGCITLEDLAAVQPFWEEPLVARFDGLDVHVPPPPADSFQFLLALGILGQAGIDGTHLSAGHLDRVFRAIRLSAECRIENANCTPDRARALLDDGNAARLAERLADPRATFGRTEGFGDGPLTEEAAEGRGHTTSMSAADAEGNAVCLTQSLGFPFGSGVVIPDTGVCMNNFMNWGDLNPASGNHLRGGERFGMCLAPSISTAQGEFALALGTPGSYGILQTQVQAMVHHRIFGLDLQAAIDAPRARLWDGRRVDLENRVEAGVVAELGARGHDIHRIEPFSMTCGGMQAIARDQGSGTLAGAADSRREGAAIGL